MASSGTRVFRAVVAIAVILLASACSTYQGTARDFDCAELERRTGWLAVPAVEFVGQDGPEDCGIAATATVLRYWQLPGDVATIAAACPPQPGRGVQAGALRDHLRQQGLAAFVIRGTLADLEREVSKRRPVVVGLSKPHRGGPRTHYEVVVALHPRERLVVTLDPAHGWRANSFAGFGAEWCAAGHPCLVAFPPPDHARTKELR